MGKPINEVSEIRVGVECCIVYKDNVLLQKRSAKSSFYPNYLCFPGGHIDEGETAIEACIREVKEETGISLIKDDMELVQNVINTHVDKRTTWIVFCFRIKISEKLTPIDTEEGECNWHKISDINLSEITPPVRDYFNEVLSTKKVIFSAKKY